MFAEDLELAFDLIEQFPHAGEEVPHRRISPLRLVLLARRQYHLYYTVYADGDVIGSARAVAYKPRQKYIVSLRAKPEREFMLTI
jgi:hypothetical protein